MTEIAEQLLDPEEEEDVVLIPKSQYTEEEEEKVTMYMATLSDVLEKIGMVPFEKNTTKFTRVKIPDFKGDVRKKDIWEDEELDRCEFGYKGMSGKMYFYFNYGWIMNLEKGKFVPDYRVCQNEWFKLLTKIKKEGGWGIACVKRRRVGASWLEASDALHDVLFTPFLVVGMNSRTKEDSRTLFEKVGFMFENLPVFLRAIIGSRTKDSIHFYDEEKDELGNDIKVGHQSYIVVKAPTVSAFEGHMLNKWICDEAGKQEELPQMWSFTEETMMQETKRIGIPVLFGTSGEIGRAGRGLKEMWDNSNIYRLHRFFFAGYMGLMVDEFGNDMVEETIRWIVYERKRKEGLSIKMYYDFLQKYPLTIEEAFAQSTAGGLGNIVKIKKQDDELVLNPPKATKGWFKPNREKEIVFVPDPLGAVIIYEHAKKGIKDGYVAGCDPVDHNLEFPDPKLSQLSMYIIRKRHGLESPKIVASYTDRPLMVNDYYEQAAMMLQYYNNTKVLIEKNRAKMVDYFDETGLKYLLQPAPQGIIKLTGGRQSMIGVNMTKGSKDYLKDLCAEYIDYDCEWIPDRELLKEFLIFGSDNTDRVMAFGLALMLLKEDKTISHKKGATDRRLPSHGYAANAKGEIRRTTGRVAS
jgi:hypothetical protein